MAFNITPTERPPTLPDPAWTRAQQETLLRTRMLEGDWEQDLRDCLLAHVGPERLEGWNGLDASSNPFKVIVNALSVLYDSPATVRNSSGELAGFSQRTEADTAGVLEAGGLWAILQRNQAHTIGLRQNYVRITTSAEGPQGRKKAAARFRMVSPAFVVASAKPEQPDVPVSIAEARLRRDPRQPEGTGDWIWLWDVLDISNPDDPSYTVHLDGAGKDAAAGEFLGEDVTELVLGGNFAGALYPYRFADGSPHLPYVLYQAQRGHGRLTTPFEGRELVWGTLNLAVGWSLFYHILRDCSHPQRWMINLTFDGGTVDSNDHGEKRTVVIADAATVIPLRPVDSEFATVQVGQWNPGGDPKALAETLLVYSSRIAQDAGLSPTDVQKTTGNARSGYAISMTNQGKREAQNRFREAFAWADTQLLSITAAMTNRTTETEEGLTPTAYPEDGYTIEYAAIPLSPDELRARDEHVLKMTEAGYMSKLEGFMLTHPGISEQQAAEELAAITPVPLPAPQGAQSEEEDTT